MLQPGAGRLVPSARQISRTDCARSERLTGVYSLQEGTGWLRGRHFLRLRHAHRSPWFSSSLVQYRKLCPQLAATRAPGRAQVYPRHISDSVFLSILIDILVSYLFLLILFVALRPTPVQPSASLPLRPFGQVPDARRTRSRCTRTQGGFFALDASILYRQGAVPTDGRTLNSGERPWRKS